MLARLRPEFPTLSVSKVRYLDAQGLVSPQRRESGYREYSEHDIERLRFVLTAQQERYWPLKVIREALDAFDRGLAPDLGPTGQPTAPPPPSDPDLPTPDHLVQPVAELRLTAAELARSSGLSTAQIEELATFHLVRPDAQGHFDGHDLAVARAAGHLSDYGLAGRHLRPFRLAADREIGLIEQLDGPGRRRRAEILAACLALHTALVKAGLRE